MGKWIDCKRRERERERVKGRVRRVMLLIPRERRGRCTPFFFFVLKVLSEDIHYNDSTVTT